MSQISPKTVEVNFNVEIDASGNIEVFNQAKPVVPEYIVATETLPATALYDPSGNVGLLELWEPSDSQGDIKVQLADVDSSASGGLNLSGKYQTACQRLAEGFQKILCHSFDCSNATPFSNYTSNIEYYKQRDFGRVALATYAHYMFGHVDATAAITNDKAFVEAMLSVSAGGDDETATGKDTRYAAWTKTTTGNVQTWSNSGTAADANLAIRLVKALVNKGLSTTDASGVPVVSAVSENNTAKLSHIVGQVVGQDATRLMDVDNSQRTLDKHQLLRFYAGDIIYVTIKLKQPSVSIGTTGQLVSESELKGLYTTSNEESFTIKITLA